MSNVTNPVGASQKYVLSEKPGKFPDYIPLYGKETGLKWEQPVSKVKREPLYAPRIFKVVFSQSERSKDLNPGEVKKYYEDYFRKLGWENVGTAGGGGYFGMHFRKGEEQCNILYTLFTKGDNHDNPPDPKGAKIQVQYEKDLK